MDDELDKLFDDLRYPGSRRLRPEPSVAAKTQSAEGEAWDSRPHIKTLKGKETEFFTIEALCKAFGGKAPVTVRLWMRKGYIPSATYRLPDVERNGRVIKGRRLFTRGQVEALVRIAKQHDILHAKRVEWKQHPTFGTEVAEAWLQLASA